MKKYKKSGMYVKMALTALMLLLVFFLQPAAAAEPYDICYQSDFSSTDAHLGIVQTKAVEMLVNEVNKAGGIKGRPINLIIQDNNSDSSKAIGIAKMFKDQYKCKVMMADVMSGVGLALQGWGNANKFPVIMSSPQSNRLIVENQKAWLLRVCTPAITYVHAALARMKKLGYTKIAFEGTTLAWGADTLAAVKEQAPKYGIQLVYSVLIEPKTKDLSIQVKQMKDSGAQAMIATEFDAEMAVLARAMSSVGWKTKLIHTSQATFMSGMAMSDPKLFEDWETISMADPTRPEVQKVWAKTKAFSPNVRIDEDEKAIRSYEAMSLLLEALKVAKDLDDSTAIRDAFYNIDQNYVRTLGRKGGKGGFTTAKNHIIEMDDLIFMAVKSGKLVAVK